MNANPILLQKKYARIVELFASKKKISIDKALGIFYHSEVYQLMRDGISDMHCMSDSYLEKELEMECEKKLEQVFVIFPMLWYTGTARPKELVKSGIAKRPR